MNLPRILIFAAATLSLHAAPTLTDLGTLGGTYSNLPFGGGMGGGGKASSYSGSVLVGSSSLAGNNFNHAFIYSGGVMTDLGTLGGDYSNANGISANGSVVIGSSNLVGNNTNHAFIYSGGVMTDLGTLGGNYSNARGISANGSVVIGSSSIAGNNTNHAFIYSGGVMTDLGTLGGHYSNASGISANGSVVVGSSSIAGNNNSHAFIYSGGVMTDLGTLGGDFSNASGISANGSVVIGSSSIAGNSTTHAFIYSGGVMTNIGTLLVSAFGNVTGSDLFGVSDDGLVAAGYYSNGTGIGGFYYKNGVVTNMGNLGGTFSYAAGVSGDGSLLFGNSSLANGEQRAVTLSLSPVAPTTISTTITASDTRVTGGNTLQFQGGTLAPVGAVTLNLASGIEVLASSTGTLDATSQNISSTGLVTISGTSLTLTGSTNSIISLSGAISGTGMLINAAGNNVISGTNTSGGISVTGGSLRVANLASFTGAGSTVTTGGTIILPTNIAFSGAVTIAGSGGVGQAGALVLDGTGSSAAGLSGIAVNLSGNATVALRGNQDYTLSGAIAGTAPGKNLTLDIANRSLKLTGTTASSVSQVTKTGVGTLLIDTTGVVNSGTVVVSAGLLTNNGTINGGISVSSTGKLGGSGLINGSITVAGALAPGNSPGILTQATGNATLGPGGSFEAELGGTTAGNGNGFHDQFLVQSGSITLGSGVLLEVKSWLKADGVTPFTAARRDVFSILGASAGITGTFADISTGTPVTQLGQSNFTTWMLYDNQVSAHTLGNLYGTGLLGSQTFAAYATVPWQTGILSSIWNQSVTASASSTNTNPAGFINSDTLAGKAAVIVLTSADLNRDLALMSPEAYLAVSDFGLTVGRDLLGQALDNGSLWKEGNWTVAAGYSRSQHDYLGGNDAVSNYRLQSNTSLASVRYQLAPTWQVGTFFGYTDGQTNGGAASSKVRGNTFGLLADGSTAVGGRDISLRAAVSFGGFSYDMNRSGSIATDQKLRTVSAELSASTDVYKSEKLSFGPEISLVYGRARTSALDEVGGTLPLSVAASLSESLVSTAGLELTYQMTSEAVITVKAGWEHEFADAADVSANFSGGSGSGFSATASQSRNTAVGGLDLGIRLPGAFTLHLTGEVRDNRQFNRNVVLGANLNRRF